MRFARPYIMAYILGLTIALGVSLTVIESPILGTAILSVSIAMTIVYLKDDLL